MPSRILKESICTSETLDRLSAFQETFFYRLIVNCDDYGRMDARPKILASRLFPLKDLRASQIEDALRALTSAELVILYEVDGKPFLQMKTWDRHQQVRARKSKYPSADEGVCNQLQSIDINCNQMISDDSKCSRNPIQSESESESKTKAKTRPREVDEQFDAFWKEYPNKSDKQLAVKAWKKLNPDEELFAAIMQGLSRWKGSAQWQEDDGRYIPYPSKWLNNRRWEDEVRQGHSQGKQVVAQQYEQRDYVGTQDEAINLMKQMMKEAGAL